MFYIYLYLFIVIILSGLLVVNVSNPVHSIFFLVFLFLNSAVYLFLLRNEFLSIMFIIVYVGAIAVLFLFVIMMLNVKIIELKMAYINYIPLSILVLIFFMLEFTLYIKLNNLIVFSLPFDSYVYWLNFYQYQLTNIHVFGFYLYNYYSLFFITSAFVLFVATLGAILLTLFFNYDFFYQFLGNRNYQDPSKQYFVNYKLNLE